MLLLLDENLPKKLKQEFLEHQTYTVREKGWSGISNGQLLKLMVEEGFDAFITFDQNLQYQQNFKNYSLAVIVLVAPDNSYLTLKNLVPKILELLATGPVAGAFELRL